MTGNPQLSEGEMLNSPHVAGFVNAKFCLYIRPKSVLSMLSIAGTDSAAPPAFFVQVKKETETRLEHVGQALGPSQP